MMNGGPSGFHNAPATRAFVIACTTLTVLAGIKGRSAKIGLSQQDIFRHFNFWKFALSVLTFSSTPELMFGSYLLYYFRVFERQIGSNKYSVFILFSIIVSLLFEVVTLKLLDGSSLSSITAGPYGLIFSSFVPFFFDIPVSTWFLVFGIRFSDKSFIYLAGLQLLFSAWKRSIIPGICGVLAGSLYRFNIFHIRRMKFPKFITSLFSAGVFNTPSPPPPPPRPSPVGFTSLQHQVEENRPSPGEESIGALVSMGFDRNAAIQALVQARNDVNTATNILLEAQSH